MTGSERSEPAVDPACEFCRIIRGSNPARVVYATDKVLAFLPVHPAALGHTLVIPKKHIPDLWALDDELAAYLMKAVLHVSKAVKAAMKPEGLNIIESTGRAASQTVFHLHVHVVPRWQNDRIGQIWPEEKATYSAREMDDVADRISRTSSISMP